MDADFIGESDGSADHPFTTIREGIEAALTAAGDDEVVIRPTSDGRPYPERIAIAPGTSPDGIQGFNQFNGNLVIRGATGNPVDTGLTGGSRGPNLYINAPINVTIKDLTLSGGASHGVVNRSDNAVVLDHLIVRNHNYGSGIVHQGANLTIRNSDVFSNYFGIWVGTDLETQTFVPDSLTVENTVSRNNYYSGLYVTDMTGSLTTVKFSGVNNSGAGLNAMHVPSVSISAGSFSNNGTRGLALWDVQKATIDGVLVQGNAGRGLDAVQIAKIAVTGGSFSNNHRNGINLSGIHGAAIDGVLVEGNGGLQGAFDFGGGGIHVQPATSDPIMISNSIIRNNATNRWGGGFEMYNWENSAVVPTITFRNTVVSGNQTLTDPQSGVHGGGISVYGYGNLEIFDSKITNNQAASGGGIYYQGLAVGSHLTIDGSTIDSNTAFEHAGLDQLFAGTTTLTNSTFSRNKATSGTGGLRLGGITGRMSNVTVSGNTSTHWLGGAEILAQYSFLVSHSTIVNNSGEAVGGLRLNYPTVRLINNVVASNHATGTATDPPTAPFVPSPDVNGEAQSFGGNFIGDATGSHGFDPLRDSLGDATDPLDPVLSGLQDNGGKTLTHKPLAGSPLIDAGVVPVTFGLPATDQRGVARPQQAGYDIGSVEIENSAPTLIATSSSVSIDEGQTAENGGTFADLDGDAVALSASVGTVTQDADGSWHWSFASDDGPGENTVTITAKDGLGGVTTVAFELNVNNVAPTVQLSATSPIQSGQATTLTLSASDPSQADAAAGFTYQIDWESDGTFDEEASGAAAMASHVFTALGVHTMTVVAVDKDGGTSQPISTETTVVPVPLTIVADAAANLNSTDKGHKTLSVVVRSTAAFDARGLNTASVVWAGAHVYKSSYKDVDRDGDIDAVFEFLLAESNAVELYRQALAADPSNSHQVLTTELTATDSSGVNYLGAAEVDFFMSGKALKDLLNSI